MCPNIILCGLPCSGKTTIGSILAKDMGTTHYDTDQLICQYTGMSSCREVFLAYQEQGFHQLESHILTKINVGNTSVISLGGKTLFHPPLVPYIKTVGVLFYLDITIQTAIARLQKRGLPMTLANYEICELKSILIQRRQHFLSLNPICVTPDLRNPNRTCQTILSLFNNN